MGHRPTDLLRPIFVGLVVSGVAACAPSSQSRLPGDSIGILQTAGEKTFLNERPASTGQLVQEGDRVSTGPNSSLRVLFSLGGSVQLNEQTDPTLRQFWKQLACIIQVTVGFGEVFVDNNSNCEIAVRHSYISLPPGSKADISVGAQGMTLTVLQGKAEVTDPVRTVAGARERLTITSGQIVDRRTLSDVELQFAIAWLSKYEFEPVSRPPYAPRYRLHWPLEPNPEPGKRTARPRADGGPFHREIDDGSVDGSTDGTNSGPTDGTNNDGSSGEGGGTSDGAPSDGAPSDVGMVR